MFGNATSNNHYIFAKSHFIRNFELLNRRFTEDEKEQFLFNIDLQTKGAKKYVYNPELWNNEAEYKEYYDRMNSGKHVLSAKSKEEIARDNEEKIKAHEGVQMTKINTKNILKTDHISLGMTEVEAFRKKNII